MNLLIEISKNLRSYKGDRFLLAVSGGLDSIALFHVFLHLKEHFGFDFSVAHFHHGPSEDSVQLDFRFNAFELIKRLCGDEKIRFFSNYSGENLELFLKKWPKVLTSENDFRKARFHFLNETSQNENFQKIVFAHHQDDLLETRIMRMIRGVGPEGIKAMNFESQNTLRPLLNYSRKELKELVVDKKGRWLEDPSNDDIKSLRNWVRKKWLKELEDKNPGALNCLSRSLDLLLENSTERLQLPNDCIEDNQIILSELLCLNEQAKKQVLATYMKSQGLKDYGLSHVNEVLKRLDTERKSHTFRLLGHRWQVDAGRMSVLEAD